MEDLLRNLYGMQPGYVISGKQFFKSSMFFEIRNKRIFVLAVIR